MAFERKDCTFRAETFPTSFQLLKSWTLHSAFVFSARAKKKEEEEEVKKHFGTLK